MTINRRSLLTVAAASGAVLALPFAARAEGTLEAIKKRGTLRVGVTQAPPWYSKDPKSGEWASGLGVSMGKAMAQTLGVKFETVEVTWGTAIAALQGDKIDIMYMMDATPERAQAVDFPPRRCSTIRWPCWRRTTLPCQDLADLDKPGCASPCRRPAAWTSSSPRTCLQGDIQRFPATAAIAAFQAGRVDAVCLFHPPLLAARQRLGKGKIVVPTPAQSRRRARRCARTTRPSSPPGSTSRWSLLPERPDAESGTRHSSANSAWIPSSRRRS
jgi:polar amino acid transport system substrate-binding protein